MKIFLGSSTEALGTLERIATWLVSFGHEPIPWNAPDLFLPGHVTFLRLLEIARQVEAAVFVFAEDDKVWYRSESRLQPRDNVLLEYGMFAGALGQERVAICRLGNPKNASDLAGLTTLNVREDNKAVSRKKLRTWLSQVGKRQEVGGPDLSGRWSSHDSLVPGSPAVGTAQIVHGDGVVMMSLRRRVSRDGSPTDRTFDYRGHFTSGQLTLLFEDRKGKGYITGAMVVRLSSTLDELVGKTMYFDMAQNSVTAYDFALRRTVGKPRLTR